MAVATHVEFDFAGEFEDGSRMTTVLEQRILDGFLAADEQAAEQTVLFLGDPLATAVPANEDDCRCCAARWWRFDELHVSVPSGGESRAPQAAGASVAVFFRARVFDWCRVSGDCSTHAANIFPAGYEFEGGGTAIS